MSACIGCAPGVALPDLLRISGAWKMLEQLIEQARGL
jgi:hypothetical protein